MSVASRPRAQAANDAWIALGIAILLILAALGARAYLSARPETVPVATHDIFHHSRLAQRELRLRRVGSGESAKAHIAPGYLRAAWVSW
jgi:hypothetical protein